MTFLVTLIALLIERFFDWSHIRHWGWYTAYQRTISQKLPGKSASLVLAATIIPLLIAVLIITVALDGVLYGLANLLFQLFILLYCFGPQNLWADAFACINALAQGDAQAASDKLKALFGITNISQAQTAHKALVDQLFIQANQRVFAVVFWYVLLGPMGAVLYRSINLSSHSAFNQESSPEVAQVAYTTEQYLDWLPIRFFTFLFALGGQFSQVFACWHKKVANGVKGNENLLTSCGMAALGQDESQPIVAETGATEKEVISLLDRVFVIALVAVAIVALAV